MNDESLRTRIIGLGLLCLGIALFYVDYNMRRHSDSYYPMLSFLVPLMIALAIDFIIETPKIPMENPSFFGWICIACGSLVGFWNAFF